MNKTLRIESKLILHPMIILIYIVLWIINIATTGLLIAHGDPAAENVDAGMTAITSLAANLTVTIPTIFVTHFFLQLGAMQQLPIRKKSMIKCCIDLCFLGTLAIYIPQFIILGITCITSGSNDIIALSSPHKIIFYILTSLIVSSAGIFTACITLKNPKRSIRLAWWLYPVNMLIFCLMAALKSELDSDVALSDSITPAIIAAAVFIVIFAAALYVRNRTSEKF